MIIVDYNKTKDGVDSVDYMCSTYSTLITTWKWPLAVSFYKLDIASIHSCCIYSVKNPTEDCEINDYLKKLALALMKHDSKERATNQKFPNDLRRFCLLIRIPKNGVPCNTCNQNVCKNHRGHCVTWEKWNGSDSDKESDEDADWNFLLK